MLLSSLVDKPKIHVLRCLLCLPNHSSLPLLYVALLVYGSKIYPVQMSTIPAQTPAILEFGAHTGNDSGCIDWLGKAVKGFGNMFIVCPTLRMAISALNL
jgi:hypothetical protein